MPLVVQKFGGSSVADAEHQARRPPHRRTKRRGIDVAVVVSAMGDSTDDLLDLAQQVSPEPAEREMDMLLTAGERISMALLAMAIHDHGEGTLLHRLPGWNADHRLPWARSDHRRHPRPPAAGLDEGAIPVLAGFQGVSPDTKDVTTLGRGGSDTTAVALAAALGADVCGSTRRRWCLHVRSAGGAAGKTTARHHLRRDGGPPRVPKSSICDAWVCASPIFPSMSVHPSSDIDGTLVLSDAAVAGTRRKGRDGRAHRLGGRARPLGRQVDHPGYRTRTRRGRGHLEIIARVGANLDMIVQNIANDGRTDITLTLKATDADGPSPPTDGPARHRLHQPHLRPEIAKVTLVGAGMRRNPGVSATFFRALADAGVNVEMISTSEIRISVVCSADDAGRAVKAIHAAFGLDADQEAVVYAGTGR